MVGVIPCESSVGVTASGGVPFESGMCCLVPVVQALVGEKVRQVLYRAVRTILVYNEVVRIIVAHEDG